jgi:hypothetical protein
MVHGDLTKLHTNDGTNVTERKQTVQLNIKLIDRFE